MQYHTQYRFQVTPPNTELPKDFLTLWQIKQLEVCIVLLQADVPLHKKKRYKICRALDCVLCKSHLIHQQIR